jgi:hypothetical protein
MRHPSYFMLSLVCTAVSGLAVADAFDLNPEPSRRKQSSFGIHFGRFASEQLGEFSAIDNQTLPQHYTLQLGDAKDEIVVSTPLSTSRIDSTKTTSSGLVYRRPLSNNWILAASVATRASNPIDLVAGGWQASGSIASTYSFAGDSWNLTLANMVGYAKTVQMGDSLDADLSNTAYRNGVMLSLDSSLSLTSSPMSWEAYIIDTRYSGSDLFSNYHDEIGLSFGTKRRTLDSNTDLRIGFSYLFGDNVDSVKANFGGWF